MLAPDDVGRSNSWTTAKDVVRISLETKGVVGFIQVPNIKSLSLETVRPLIKENVENIPADFQFILDGGVPLSRRQEATHHIADHYPCLKIRAVKKKVTKTNKCTIYNVAGDEFDTWIPTDYTFGQLRKDAARYWNVPIHDQGLVDDDGCVWPEEASIFALLDADDLRTKKIILKAKGVVAGSSHDHPRIQFQTHHHHPFVQTNYEEKLWYIFTYYCVHGDALDLLTMTAYQFHRCLKDCHLFATPRVFTPAMGDILYAFEGKGKLCKKSPKPSTARAASGKLDYDGFLNALLSIATRFFPHAADPDDALSDLLAKYILPNAASWALHTWADHTETLGQPDVARFVAKFAPCLLEIFMFYTNQPQAAGAFMTFSDCMRFVQDFRFTELLLTTQECPELFLAACHSAATAATDVLVARETMTFHAFLDMLGRAGLYALTRHRRLEPLQCVKAVFHHMTRSLRGSRVLEIIQNHGPVAIHASRLYAGSVAFNNKFLDMWRVEGSPDYVTGSLPATAPTLTRGRQSIHQIVNSPPLSPEAAAVYPLPTSPTHATATTSGLDDDPTATPPPPAAIVVAADNDDRAFLRHGAIFRKYGTWSSPHRRFVWLNDGGTHLHWRPLNKPDQFNEGLALESVQSLLSGHAESTRYAFMKYLTEDKYVQRCFSIVAKDRRLDLEADSEATRDRWIHALRALLPRAKTS
ncbi:Aste57867_650 [Aphanomyces stellatus]|uniref:Aste57867_650 protein n=1 Tax=Aphanomyces stellatus TaxID=120398 RepID=A0A485K3H1_9STRA|nr:hypothetical protein As57867_000649 [Aphanomyces stellatus]VFT77875.1 Aste57867_650 [Aphanomyces stellatus]